MKQRARLCDSAPTASNECSIVVRDARSDSKRLRSLPFETAMIEQYRRPEESVEEALAEMYLAAVSVPRVEDITEASWGTRVSSGTVSRGQTPLREAPSTENLGQHVTEVLRPYRLHSLWHGVTRQYFSVQLLEKEQSSPRVFRALGSPRAGDPD